MPTAWTKDKAESRNRVNMKKLQFKCNYTDSHALKKQEVVHGTKRDTTMMMLKDGKVY